MFVHWRSAGRAIAVLSIAACSARFAAAADAKPGEFTSNTIDVGIVVSDVDRAVKFYTEAIGMRETMGFSVPASFGADIGLADNKPLAIRVLVLGDAPTATRLKLMEVRGTSPKKSDNGFIHSQLGYRYLTVFVADADAANERLKKAGVKPLGKGTVPLPAGLPQGLAAIVVRDPDGNLVELIARTK
jgi:lactoylglutathione lyase